MSFLYFISTHIDTRNRRDINLGETQELEQEVEMVAGFSVEVD
jgi:hypothetical protein